MWDCVQWSEFSHQECLEREARDPPFLDPPNFPLPPGSSCVGSWVGVGKPHAAEKLPLKSSEPKARSQNQRLPCFLECITGYCPHQTKPFHQRFFKTLFSPPLFCFEISWATINFREREREKDNSTRIYYYSQLLLL